MSTLAVDIGGANLKFASDAGGAWAVPFALWQQPEVLASQLLEQFYDPAPERVLATMTGELCDCFASRAEGVGFILDHLEAAADQAQVRLWSMERRFVDPAAARARPDEVAAGNWHALGHWLAPLWSSGLTLVMDVGSTTTDLIPLRDGELATASRSDRQRLASGELVYLGAGRTPLMALGEVVELDGVRYGTMAEHFATLADALVLTGDLPEQPESAATADGRPLTRQAAARRVLRMIGQEPGGDGEGPAQALAGQYRQRAVQRLQAGATHLLGEQQPERVVISGSGVALGRLAAETWSKTRLVGLEKRIGAEASEAACAYALLQLWHREGR